MAPIKSYRKGKKREREMEDENIANKEARYNEFDSPAPKSPPSPSPDATPESILTIGSPVPRKEVCPAKRLHFVTNGDMRMETHHDTTNGEVIVNLKYVPTSIEIKKAEHLAHIGGMLLCQAEMLRKLGEDLLS